MMPYDFDWRANRNVVFYIEESETESDSSTTSNQKDRDICRRLLSKVLKMSKFFKSRRSKYNVS